MESVASWNPTPDEVFAKVGAGFPLLARATVYNTLNAFEEAGLLQRHTLSEGRVVFDPNMEPHHHFIDLDTGAISDVPSEALSVPEIGRLRGYDVSEYMVVLRGRKRTARSKKPR